MKRNCELQKHQHEIYFQLTGEYRDVCVVRIIDYCSIDAGQS